MGSRHPLIAPFGAYTSADGHVVIANVKEWDLFCSLIERDDLVFDDRFVSNRARLENIEALEHELNAALVKKTTEEWFDILRETNVCAVGKVNSLMSH